MEVADLEVVEAGIEVDVGVLLIRKLRSSTSLNCVRVPVIRAENLTRCS